ncbi:hypothetical protein BBJ28_00018510 [Nothophytophthora sp. Chile5]|nr:hypothetical protein BBJ28_00018510 [Nothophytophthora sp. Chile5]
MGAATSKTSSSTAAAAASNARRTRIIRTSLTLERLEALARGAASDLPPQAAAIRTGAVEMSSARVDAHGTEVELMEMQSHLLQDMRRFDDYDRVDFLAESTRAFEATASSHRPRSSEPVRMPRDRTAAVSATGDDDAPVTGRLTNRDMRALLRLRYEAPESWTVEVLADKYGMEHGTMRSILNSVGPPKVLPPRGMSEFPLGVWFDAPAAAVTSAATKTSELST